MVLNAILIPFFIYVMNNIAKELADFFQTGNNKIEPINSEDNNVLIRFAIWIPWLIIIVLYLFFIIFYFQINNYKELAKISYLITLIIIILLGLLPTILFRVERLILYLKTNPIEDLHQYHYDNFNKAIEKLSQNESYENLKKEEILIKIKISKRESKKEQLRVLSPSITLLVVISTVIYLRIPNEQLELQPYGVISVLGLVTAVVTFILQSIIVYSIGQISVYKESLIILQEALIIAKERENSNHSRHQSDTVLLSRAEYEELIEELEELEDIKAYDEAIAANDEAIPFEQAIVEIEQNRR